METKKYYTLSEMMVKTAALQIPDGCIVFVGVGLPTIAACFAQKTTAPRAITLYEGGSVRASAPPSLGISIDDIPLITGADGALGMLGPMSALYRGEVDISFIGGAQVDIYGNVNSTGVGNFKDPSKFTFFVGSGGANDMASCGRHTIVIMPQDRKKFVQKVDYLTSPGYLDGPGAREKAGLLPDRGPIAIVTTMGLWKFDEETKKAYLAGYYPGVTIEQIKEGTGWSPFEVAKDVKELEPPTKEEVELMHEIDPSGLILR